MFTRNLFSRLFMLATAVAFFVVAATSAFAQTKLLRFPDVYGDRVAFTYAGDIWTAPAAGGTAIRLTAHPGMEVFAKFSPDGKWIAFTGQYDGNFNVYVMPAEGGQPKQLSTDARLLLAARHSFKVRRLLAVADGPLRLLAAL